MHLDLDGILQVTAVEKGTGHSKHVTITNAMRARTPEEIAVGRRRIRELFESRADLPGEGWDEPTEDDVAIEEAADEARVIEIETGRPAIHDPAITVLLERSRRALEGMHPDDRDEAIDLHDRIEAALEAGDVEAARQASDGLKELLFFIEGQV